MNETRFNITGFICLFIFLYIRANAAHILSSALHRHLRDVQFITFVSQKLQPSLLLFFLLEKREAGGQNPLTTLNTLSLRALSISLMTVFD